MKRLALVTGILALAAPLALAQASTWTSDPAHSAVVFSVRHMTISNVQGRIGKVAATLLLNETDIIKSSVTATIDVSTIDTGEPARDTHLKSPDFFDVEKFPTAKFVSTTVVKSGSGLTVNGNLTLHGVTKPVVLEVEGPIGPIMGMDKKPHSGFSATTTISRSAFGIGAKFPEAIVGDEVKLTIEVELIKQ
ncbi:MAG: YceI family protein [Terracidiphilus sp.]|jgi:polyisoprenoid-binding protein YceI